MTAPLDPDTAGLIQLAKAALAAGESPATITERIVGYSDAFDRWYSGAKPLIDVGASAARGGVELLRELEEFHAKVMARAKEVLVRTELDSKGLRQRGKGMVAYTDILPKQISTKKLPRG